MKKSSGKKTKSQKKSSGCQQKSGKNYIEEEAKYWSKDYTNEHIRAQIKRNSELFGFKMGLLAFALLVLLLSFIIAFISILPEVSLFRLLSEVINNGVWGPVIAIPLMVIAGVGIHESDSLSMIKHIRPACSGKRFNAHEIDEMANDPDTTFIGDLGVFAAPKAFIGINKGITVVEYEDIEGISIKSRHHMENESNTVGRGRMSAGRAAYYALTDHYKEWDTYYIVVKTKKHRKLVLTEAQYNGYESLIPVIKERCSNAEDILKPTR